MPRGDGTGPNGMGPMTGRGMGRCGGGSAASQGRVTGRGRGQGAGRGRAGGTGSGQGAGRGRASGTDRNW